MIAIISDIHGNFEALKEVLKEIDKLKIKEIYCLGDIVGYYSQINECCNELRKRNAICIMGNHDWYMVSGSKCLRSQSVNDCIEYQRAIITLENLDWLKTLPIIINKNNMSMVHGGWNNPIDEYLEPSKEYFDNIKGKIFISGHSHIQQICKYKEKIYCNPGSVGQPRDGNNKAAFAIFKNNNFTLKRVSYDIEKTCYLMQKAGFDSYYYGSLRDGAKKLHR